MTERPAPLSAEGCDVRGMEWMPLHGRVFGSRFYSLALRDPRAGWAGLKLWWEAWQQCPAGSLPNDEFDLSRMADFGSDLKGWRKVRAIALHGFIECDDGRLYHPLICSEAKEAWERRKRDRERKAQQRAKRWAASGEDTNGNTDGHPNDVPWDTARTDDGTEPGRSMGQGKERPRSVRSDRTGQDRTEKKELPLPSGSVPSDAEPGRPEPPLDPAPAASAEPGPNVPPPTHPAWPPPPLASSATAEIGAVVASLTGRKRGNGIPGPLPPVRTAHEQISAVEPPPLRASKPLDPATLATLRRRVGGVG